jgi:predicted dehydrogenase
MNRREFMQKSVAGLALSAAGRYSAEAADSPAKRVGLIGCGWYGKSDIFRLVQVAPVEIVSLCDVDKKMMADCAEMAAARQASHKKPRMFTDYREMLREKDLDLVEIATPDHWHALPMIEAARAGADMYVQKPISVDVVEGQAMLAAARHYKRVVQVGTQRRSTPHLIEARNLIQEGKLGTIGHVEIYSYGGGRATAAVPAPVPDTLDWEFWVGPAPMLPYSPDIQRNWRQFMEYGNGTIGDMGIHMFDMVRWFMGLGWPKRISSFWRVAHSQGRQIRHRRHPDRHVRVRQPRHRLAASPLRSAGGSELPVGRHAVWRARHFEGRGDGLRFYSGGAGRAGDSQRRRPTSWTSIRKTAPRPGWSVTWPRPSAVT